MKSHWQEVFDVVVKRLLLLLLLALALALAVAPATTTTAAAATTLLMLKRMWKHELCLKCLTIMAPAILAQALLLGSLNPTLWKQIEGNNFRTNPEQAMASSATSATSFELIEDQALTAEEVEMASQEAQEVRTREAAVAARGAPRQHRPLM